MGDTRPSVISLFSGVGGLDLGLAMAGFDIRTQIDADGDCARSLEHNRDKYWCDSRIIRDRIENWPTPRILKRAGLKKGEVALVCGGPPCQPFSKSAFWSPTRWADAKSMRLSNKNSRSMESFMGLEDPRADSLKEFARIVREASPAIFAMENVSGLAYKTSRSILDAFVGSMGDAGYSCIWQVLNAADYGVPQMRKRLFAVGGRDGLRLSFPKATHSRKERLQLGRNPHVTAGEAIGDLDGEPATEDEIVGGKWGHLLPEIPPGDNYLFFTKERGYPKPIFKWRSRYWSFLLKLSPSMPSWTIQAQPGPYVGPFHWNDRRLKTAEVKRLQTFPDDYEVCGDRRSAQRQLGNAVPPRLAHRIGSTLRRLLEDGNGE